MGWAGLLNENLGLYRLGELNGYVNLLYEMRYDIIGDEHTVQRDQNLRTVKSKSGRFCR